MPTHGRGDANRQKFASACLTCFKNENLSNSGGFNPTFRREAHIQPLLFSGSGYMTSLIKPIAPPHFRQYLAK